MFALNPRRWEPSSCRWAASDGLSHDRSPQSARPGRQMGQCEAAPVVAGIFGAMERSQQRQRQNDDFHNWHEASSCNFPERRLHPHPHPCLCVNLCLNPLRDMLPAFPNAAEPQSADRRTEPPYTKTSSPSHL